MTTRFVDQSERQIAVIGGLSLILMAIVAGFTVGFVLDVLIVPGDTSATVANIQRSEGLFRAGIFGWILILLLDVVVAWALYLFLRPVNSHLSLLTAWLRMVYAAVLGTGISHLVGVLLVVNGVDSTSLFGPDQMEGLVTLLLGAFYGTWQTIGLLVFGCHLLLLGYLVVNSGYVPKVLGTLIVIAALGYIITHGGNLLLPSYARLIATLEAVFILPMIVGEVGLGLWMVVKGGKGENTASARGTSAEAFAKTT